MIEDQNILKDSQDEYGTPRFSYDDSVFEPDIGASAKKSSWKSPAAIYFLAVGIFIVGWLIYSIVVAVKQAGIGVALLTHMPTFSVLAVLAAIIGASATGSWGKLIRFAEKRNMLPRRSSNGGHEVRRYIQTLDALDARKSRRCAVTVYKSHVEVVNNGESAIYERKNIRGVSLWRTRKYFTLSLKLQDCKTVYANAQMPLQIYGEMIRAFDGRKVDEHYYEDKYESAGLEMSVAQLIGLTFFMLIFVGAGVALICGNRFGFLPVPLLLGLFFLFAGIIGLFSVYSFITFIKLVVMPMLLCAFLTVAPMMIISILYENALGIKLTVQSFFAQCNAFSCVAFVFAALGLMGIISAVRSAADYFMYLRKKKTDR